MANHNNDSNQKPNGNGAHAPRHPWVSTFVGPYFTQGPADGIAYIQMAHLLGELPQSGNAYLKVTHSLFPQMKIGGFPMGVGSLLVLDPSRLNPNKGKLTLEYETKVEHPDGRKENTKRTATNTPLGIAALLVGMGVMQPREHVRVGNLALHFVQETGRVVLVDRETNEVLWSAKSTKKPSKKSLDTLLALLLIEAGLPEENLVAVLGPKYAELLAAVQGEEENGNGEESSASDSQPDALSGLEPEPVEHVVIDSALGVPERE